MKYITIFGVIFYILLVVLTSMQESKRRRIHFVTCLIILFATSLVGYFIVSSFPIRNPMVCNWCGNKENEAEMCGVCGKKVTNLKTDGEG